MELITSTQNNLIKKIRLLQRTQYRQEYNLFLAEGYRTIRTLVDNQFKPVHLLCTQELVDEALKLAPTQVIIQVQNHIMDTITSSVSPSGLLGVFSIPTTPKLDQLNSGLVLANISDPGNMGTLIRTTAAMGFKTVVCVDGTDPWSQKVVQASVGTIAAVNIFQIDWTTLIEAKKNLILSALVVSDGVAPTQLNTKNTLLVIGSEAHGIPEEWVKQCDQHITLPMPGKTESLNAAIAGSIALYLLAQAS